MTNDFGKLSVYDVIAALSASNEIKGIALHLAIQNDKTASSAQLSTNYKDICEAAYSRNEANLIMTISTDATIQQIMTTTALLHITLTILMNRFDDTMKRAVFARLPAIDNAVASRYDIRSRFALLLQASYAQYLSNRLQYDLATKLVHVYDITTANLEV